MRSSKTQLEQFESEMLAPLRARHWSDYQIAERYGMIEHYAQTYITSKTPMETANLLADEYADIVAEQ